MINRGYLLFLGEYRIYFIECVENIRIFMSAQHAWKFRCFQLTRWNIFGIHLKKVNFLFILYFFRRFPVNQFVNHVLSRITIMGVFVTEYTWINLHDLYSHQDLQIKRNLFSVKVRDKWRHKRRHNLLMTLRSRGYTHCLTHWSGSVENSKSKNFSKSELFWYQNVPHVLTKKMTTHTWCFCSQIRKL